MKIGIIAALSKEAELIIEKMSDRNSVKISGSEFFYGFISGKEVICAVCGVGKVNAATCTQSMIMRFSPDLIINTGVGGSLSPELKVGDLVVATEVCQHDMDTAMLDGSKGVLNIAGKNIIFIKTDRNASEKLAKIAVEKGISVRRGRIASGDQFISDSEKKRKITENFGAVCCEMEGGAIGHVCKLSELPFAVVRSISDNADEDADYSFEKFVETSAVVSANIVIELIAEI